MRISTVWKTVIPQTLVGPAISNSQSPQIVDYHMSDFSEETVKSCMRDYGGLSPAGTNPKQCITFIFFCLLHYRLMQNRKFTG